MDFVIWAIAGWCGTPWGPRINIPVPPPPDPWVPWKVAGVIGGLAGGYLISTAFSEPMPGIVGIVGAFLGGRFLGDITDRFLPKGR